MTALPTTFAPDGTPVAPYLRLPAHEEAGLIHRVLPSEASILELGCGAGRVSQRLADLGHRIIAVDQSPEMIEHVGKDTGVMPIRADIESLVLEQTFDGVVLASYLVNAADDSKRARFLAACRRHVAEDGAVIIQRLDPEVCWMPGATSLFGPVRVELVAAEVCDRVLCARLEYRIDGQVFPQAIVAKILDDDALMADLSGADLRVDRWIDAQRTWLVARAVPRASVC